MIKRLILALCIIALNLSAQAQELSAMQDESTGLFGFADQEGNYVVKPIYKEVALNFGFELGQLYKVVNKNDKQGYVNDAGKEVIPCKYDEVGYFRNGHVIVKIKGSEQYSYLHGLLDSTGREVIPVKYGRLEYYPEENVLVAGETGTSDVGLLDMKGKWIITPQYEFWSKIVSEGLWPVGKDDICGVVNLKNEVVVPFTFEMIESYSEELDLALAKKEKGGKYGFIDRKGKEVIPYMYNDGWPGEKYLIVKKDGKWGVITIDNKVVLPFEYSAINSQTGNTAWVSKEENEGMYEIDLITKKKTGN